jgi:hypothetical protein
MDTYRTKYFGDFTIDETNKNGYYDMVFKGQKMYISLKDAEVGSSQLCGDYLKKAFGMLDKYVEMDETVRRYMIKNLHKIAQIYHYFKNQFDEMRDERLIEAFGTKIFEDLDIKKVVEQMKYPNVQFCIEDDELNIVLNYWASEYSPLISITMDKDLNVVGISHF